MNILVRMDEIWVGSLRVWIWYFGVKILEGIVGEMLFVWDVNIVVKIWLR